MRRVRLTYLLFGLASIVDARGHEGVTFDDLRRELHGANFWEWLRALPPGPDVSLYTDSSAGEEVRAELLRAWDGIEGRERRKTGVESNGIALLIALVTEAIQQLPDPDRPR